jgi:phospholipid/cholesterol/gamma-HCH transport system ATP-binding protein
MIEVRNIEISFDGQRIVSGVSFDVPDGTTTVLAGKNGAGKSVILKAVAGLIPVSGGSVSVDGRSPGPELYAGDHAAVSYVFQKGGLFDSISVFENIAFYLRRSGLDDDTVKRKVDDVISRVKLAGSEYKLPSELSGGMQKRVCLARAVVSGAPNILYDDPSAGLDPVLTDSIGLMIRDIQKNDGVSAILVTHDLDLIKKTADAVVLIDRGGIVFRGTPEEFFTSADPYARQFNDGAIDGPIKVL